MSQQNLWGRVKAVFSPQKEQARSLREVTAVGGVNGSDWAMSALSNDSDVWQNIFALRARMRSLFRTNPFFIKYREELWANIFGANGHLLRMRIKETEDRVVHAPDEKWALILHERRIERIRQWAERKTGTALECYRAFHLADGLDRSKSDDVIRGVATVKVGAPDVFANMLVEAKWKEWKKAENCDVRGRRSYDALCQLRLLSGARDGDHFIHMIRDPRANAFGLTLRLVNSEYCDYWLNTTLPNGNEVRMGIEYQLNSWGIGKAIAHYFIKRQPNDWQYSIPGAYGANLNLYDRVPADEVIHYARQTDADGTRPEPWCSSVIPKARHLDKYEEAEVVAAREAACKTGWIYSDVNPEGGAQFEPIDRATGERLSDTEPGDTKVLPWGYKFQSNDPKHPNGNYPEFRGGMLRSACAGMPASSYASIANDYASINFSAGRLDRLTLTEMWMVIQKFDQDIAEIPIFENFLEMGLITGAIPLPLPKYPKLNKPTLQGRRWKGVDPVKEAVSNAQNVANKFTSRTRICAENGDDFEEIVFELAEEEMLIESLGMTSALTVENPVSAPSDDENDQPPNSGKPKPGKPKEEAEAA